MLDGWQPKCTAVMDELLVQFIFGVNTAGYIYAQGDRQYDPATYYPHAAALMILKDKYLPHHFVIETLKGHAIDPRANTG